MEVAAQESQAISVLNKSWPQSDGCRAWSKQKDNAHTSLSEAVGHGSGIDDRQDSFGTYYLAMSTAFRQPSISLREPPNKPILIALQVLILPRRG